MFHTLITKQMVDVDTTSSHVYIWSKTDEQEPSSPPEHLVVTVKPFN